MENKHRKILTDPHILKAQDDFNRFLYKHFITHISKSLHLKPLYVWEVSSAGISELIKDYDINWPFGAGKENTGMLCLSKQLASMIVHFSLGGSEKREVPLEHKQLTAMDSRIVEKFFATTLEFLKNEFQLTEGAQLHKWVDDSRLLPFFAPGKKWTAFAFEVSRDEQVFPLLYLSHQFVFNGPGVF